MNIQKTRLASDPARNGVAMVGASCRVPGASSLAEFWRLLVEEKNAIRKAPSGRWSVERFLRPGEPSPGFSYSFAGGYLDDPFQFDPVPFGLSSREVAQTDPQQRLLLELVWQAFEDAGVVPANLQAKKVGVYVGASSVDYQGAAALDASIIGSHFMTGNSLSVLANRISYVFDFHGPSLTVDSACSSAISALQLAIAALEAGAIDFAVVGGVNLLLSPIPFIGFAQARMMSPTGLSRPFSADADGYVRAEGGAVVLLSRGDDAARLGLRVRSYILGCAVNSDGRTSGIALPSSDGQSELIGSLYDSVGMDPKGLAFVEAHGTGTPAGDPIEAIALGEALGRRRTSPLPIGSVKSNVGHLESASGLVSLLKASLALEHATLPRSLFSENLNQSIDFAGLNLQVAQTAQPLDLEDGVGFAGVCNYGFGGTNAHVLLRSAPATDEARSRPVAGAELPPAVADEPGLMVLSAGSSEALMARALQVSGEIERGVPGPTLAAAYMHQQALMTYRLATGLVDDAVLAARLRQFGETGAPVPGMATGAQRGGQSKCAFVFSGNGAQFPEMGKSAYASSAAFRDEIHLIDGLFMPMAGWSIAQALRDGLDPEQFKRTSVIQPLIFAIQSALVSVIARYGVRPAMVMGHSIGEVAAAECSGAITREQALSIIFHRSHLQEGVRGEGGMLVAAVDEPIAVVEIAASGCALEVAALNSPASTTVVGSHAEISAFARHCRARRIATIELDLDYPFHSAAMDRLQSPMLAKLAGLKPREGHAAFISTVSGELIPGSALDAAYWWSNVRSPVRFQEAVSEALGQDAGLFVEIGPHAILTSPLAEIFGAAQTAARAVGTLTKGDKPEADPVIRSVAQLIANGAEFEPAAVVGAKPSRIIALPSYPFQRERHLLTPSAEAVTLFGGLFESAARHPLLGARVAEGTPEWRNLLDPVLLPYLWDHRVDGTVVVPASGLIEMALAAGRDLLGGGAIGLDDFDILNPLVVGADETREISTRYAEGTGTLEIWSRRRFSADKWLLHARGRLSTRIEARPPVLALPIRAQLMVDSPEQVYGEARRSGLEYGPLFRVVANCERDRFTTHVWLDQPSGGLGAFADFHVLHPVSSDAAFHGLFISRPQRDGEMKAHLPIRFRKVCVFEQGARIHRAITLLTHETERYKTVSISYLDAAGALVASVEGAVLRAVWFSRATVHDRTFRRSILPLWTPMRANALAAVRLGVAPGAVSNAWLLTRAFCVSLAHRVLDEAMTESGASSLVELREHTLIAAEARPYLDALVNVLAERDLLKESGPDQISLKELDLPSPETLLSILMLRYPEANFELHAASIAACAAGPLLRTGAFVTPPLSVQRRFAQASCIVGPAVEALATALERLSAEYGRKMRILALEPAGAGLARALAPLMESGRAEVTLALAGRNAMGEVAAIWGETPISSVELETILGSQSAPAPFDALVGLALFGPVGKSQSMLAQACKLLAPGAPVLVAHPHPEAALDVLAGSWTDWLVDSATGLPAGSLPTPDRVVSALKRCGVTQLEAQGLGDGLGSLVTGAVAATGWTAEVPSGTAEFVISDDAALAAAMGLGGAARLAPHAAGSHLSQWMEATPISEGLTIYILPHGFGLPPSEEVAERIGALKEVLRLAGGGSREVSVLLVTRQADGGVSRPEDVALHGFARVAVNEYPMVSLRMITIASGLESVDLREAVAQVRGEREFCIGTNGICVQRVRRGMSAGAALAEDERSVLRFRQSGRAESFEWVKERRPAPGAGEVEIAVAATGLNFRDVLLGLGVVDDDILQAGLTNASLGFECSGTVVRTGDGVGSLAPGDHVMGFASGAFASHVVAPAWQFVPIPSGVSLEAAATIPVAFATAWYSLVERAQVREGDDVLIHGAAGGVGLAAIQIAKRAGGRVIGTASNEARRAIAAAQGADLVLDSRGERFVDGVRAAGGADIVLNSLDGAAMLASFHLLKPFGRFIELGKKDFLDNTHLGLRPFVRNIMYSGVDLDELLNADRKAVERVMTTLCKLFENGELQSLPHQVYQAHELGAAFRAMQAAEHLGKIVIRPPTYGVPDVAAAEFKARDGAYLIVGGTSGLGFATAQWLAQRGASTLVLASRSGAIEESVKPDLERLRQSGVRIVVEPLDVRDKAAVASLVQRLIHAHGPLRGVIHAAVQLDDGLIAGLDETRLRTVLDTKIKGALNLESATDGEDLDFFVVYSSATTVVGSPGQAAYVAANAFLEGFAERRRAAGKPALAIGWGAISDVGLIARDRKLGERLQRSTGVVGIKAAEALAHLGRLLALGDRVRPLQFYTMMAPGAAAAKLALLKTPAYASLGLWRDAGEVEDVGDLDSALQGKTRSQAQAIVVKALRREAAQILRMTEDQIDPHRPLSESGFDSLMLLELVVSIERLTGLQMNVVGAGERTLTSFALRVVDDMLGAVASDTAQQADPLLGIAMQSPLPAARLDHDEPEKVSARRPVNARAKG